MCVILQIYKNIAAYRTPLIGLLQIRKMRIHKSYILKFLKAVENYITVIILPKRCTFKAHFLSTTKYNKMKYGISIHGIGPEIWKFFLILYGIKSSKLRNMN